MSSFSYNPFQKGSLQSQFQEGLASFNGVGIDQAIEKTEKEIKENLKAWLEKSAQNDPDQNNQDVARYIATCSKLVLGDVEEPFPSLVAVFKKLDHHINHIGDAEATPMQYGMMIDWRLALGLDQARLKRVLETPVKTLFGLGDDKRDLIAHYETAFKAYASAKTDDQYGEALSQLNLLSGNDENNGIINFRIGLLYLYRPELFNLDYATAFFEKSAEQLLNENTDQWSTVLLEGLVEINREEYHETLYKSDLKKWLASESYFHAAVSYYLREKFDEALLFVTKALENQPDFQEAKYLKAKLSCRLDDCDMATDMLFEVFQKERLFSIQSLLESEFWNKKNVENLYHEIRDHIKEEVEVRLEKCYEAAIPDSGIIELLDQIKKDFSNQSLLHVLASRDDLMMKRTWSTTPVVFTQKQRVFGHALRVNSISFSQDTRLMATASWKIIISDLSTGEELQTLMGHSVSEYVYSVAFSHTGQYLASASSDRTIKIWDVKTGEELRSLSGHKQSINAVLFDNSDDMLASASSDGTIKLWNVSNGNLIKTLQADKNGVNTIAFSPDGKYLAAGGWAMTVIMWDVDQKKKIKAFKGHQYCVNGLAFSPDGKTLASASWDKTIKLWDVDSGEEIKSLEGHNNGIESVKFSPDGEKLVSTSYNRNGKLCVVKLWDMETGKEEETVAGDFYGVEFSPDGHKLALASRDRTIKLWGAPTLSIEEYIHVEKENLVMAKSNGKDVDVIDPESEDDRRKVSDRRRGGFWLGSGNRRTGKDRRGTK